MKVKRPIFWDSFNFISLLLLPFSLLTIIFNFFKSLSLKKYFKIKTICVGNIYIGGTGKTPTSIFIANEFTKVGKKTAIIRKYYKGHDDEYCLIKKYFNNLIISKSRVIGLKEAEKYNLMLPVDLGARGSCTIGGNISTNAGGNMVIKYGMMRDSVLGLEAVLADGQIVSSMNQMLKNNSGYDLKQLFIGTEGTLGFITRAVLRLRERPSSINTALVGLDSFEHVIKFLKYMDKGLGGNLSAYEVMWKNFYEVVTSSKSNHTPPLPLSSSYYVIVETMGADQEKDSVLFEKLLETALESNIIQDAVVPHSESERAKLWSIRDDVEQHYQNGPVKMFDVSMPVSYMERYVEEVNQNFAANWREYKCVVFGHVGDGNLHIIGGVGSDDKKATKLMETCIYEPLKSIKGAISAEHGIGLEKKDYLEISRSEIEINLMRTLKKALDPNSILNPGKVFD